MCKIVRKDELTISRWSGGVTMQLAIYPPGAVYAERNFVWRVSSATIEVEQSRFTPLPGISRVLMILEGEVVLSHDGGPEVTLRQFEQDSFEGGSDTVSRGRATDFNLMFTEGDGHVEIVRLGAGERWRRGLVSGDGFGAVSEVYYFLTDGVEMIAGGEAGAIADCGDRTVGGAAGEIIAGAGDVLSVDAARTALELVNHSGARALIVRATVRHD